MNNVDTTKKFTHISLCTGYAGLDIGLKRAIRNVCTVAYSEFDAYACANLVAKMEKGWLDIAPIWTDVKTFPWQQFYKKVDIITAGFPCQPFSNAGKGSADKDKRHLFPYIKRGIKLIRPTFVYLENVYGILTKKLKGESWTDPAGTPVLLHVLRELERLDYYTTAGIFSASETGGVHKRERIFILAISKEHISTACKITSEFITCEEKQTNKAGIERYYSKEFKTAYPNFRVKKQKLWEAPRTTKKLDNTNIIIKQNLRTIKQSYIKKAKRYETRLLIHASKNNNVGIRNIRHARKRILKSKVGGSNYGFTCRLDLRNCLTDFNSRVQEFKLLGNGVVPDVAKKAFIILFNRLNQQYNKI